MKNFVDNLWKLIEKILYWFVYKLFKLNLSEKKWQGFLQFVRFGLVGLTNTAISLTIHISVLYLLQKNGLLPKVDYLVAHIFAFLISVLWSFYWNRTFVFHADQDGTPWFPALMKAYASYAFTGLFLNSLLLSFWVEVLHVNRYIAPLFSLLITIPLNFILNKFWAFRKKK